MFNSHILSWSESQFLFLKNNFNIDISSLHYKQLFKYEQVNFICTYVTSKMIFIKQFYSRKFEQKVS